MWLADTLANLVSGLGTTKDKTTGNLHVLALRDLAQIQAAYRTDWIARKIVDVPAFDMLREWRAWQAKDDEVQAIEAAEKALRLRGKLLDGLKLARRDGGAALVIGDGSPDPAQPLVAERMPQGGIRYIAVMSRREITPGQRERDPASEWFGEPSGYTITSSARGAQTIHPSRVIRLVGAPILDEVLDGDGWGDSVLQAVMDAVDQASSSAAYVNAMLPEAKQDVISVPGLSQHLSTAAGTKALTDRFAYAARMKSMFGMLLLEGDGKSPDGEVFEQKQISFAGLPDVVRLYLSIAAGAADIPATRLLGKSPDGQNATGDSDFRQYYDRISAEQNVDLTPRISRLDELLIRHALGDRPAEIWYRWNPLYQTSHKENADALNVIAGAVKTLAEAKVAPLEILARGVRGAVVDSGLLPGIDAAYDEHGDAPLTEADPAADQFDADGNPAEGFTGTNVVPFRSRAAVSDAAPRTLYVSRRLTNAADVLAWARDAGIPNLMPAEALHVTIAYSRQPVDWMKVGDSWQGSELKVDAGGPRLLERFGDALVLSFASGALQYRHREIGESGASWDHPEYQPHVTLSWDAPQVDVDTLAAYNGPLVFGPEIFEQVNEDWRAGLTGDAALDPEEATEAEIAAVTPDDLRALFGTEMLEGIRLSDKASGGRMSGVVAAFNELLHPRGPDGKWASKGKAAAKGSAKPAAKVKSAAGEEKLTKGAAALKTAGVSHDDEIAVLSKRVKAYAGAKTVRDFVDNHPKGKAYALRKLAADHQKGVIGFKVAGGSASEKYNADNFSDFSDTDHRTTVEVERDLYKTMLTKPETTAEKTSIGVYSGAGYSSINGHLRGKNPATALMRQNISNIDNVLARSRIPEDTVVYRGIKPPFSKEILAAKVGSTIDDPGYVSTSLKGDTSKKFATPEGVVLKMLLPKGNSAYVMNGRGASHYPKEHEVLLPRGSRFRVKSLVGNVMTVEVL
jgi:phage-related protein (TIGR01555 family)